jgi:hypothetical protein
MKLEFWADKDNGYTFEVSDEKALEYIAATFVATMESRQGKADDTTRPDRVITVLENLVNGIIPARGSKGSTREAWEAERTVILRSMLQSAGIEMNLKGDAQVKEAIVKLASHYKREFDEFSENLDKRAQERYALLNAPL